MVGDIRVVITGASGFVARNLRRHLAENGCRLVSISRRNFRAFKNEEKIISKDYEGRLLPEIRGSDAIFHLAGIGRQSAKTDYNTVNVELTRRVLDLGKRAKIKRFVFASGLGVSPKTTSDYFISKYRAEKLIVNSGLDYTIFRPSYIVGRDDALTRHLKKRIKKGVITIPGSGRYAMQPIYIGDVARVLYKSITQVQFRNKIVDLVGPQSVTFEKYVRLFSRGTRTTIRRIELERAYHDALTNKRADFGVDDLNILVGNFKGSHSRLKSLSGMRFEPVLGLLESGCLP